MSGAGSGDRLARGAASAQFETARISEEKWKAIFGEDSKKPNVMSEEQRALIEAVDKQTIEQLEKQRPDLKRAVFRPVQDRIAVERVESINQVNGIYIPDEGKEKPAEGIVIAVGPGRYVNDVFIQPTIKPGDRVVFGKYSGAEVQVKLNQYVILREEDIFGVIEE